MAVVEEEKPKCFLIVHNVAKKHNIGTLTRCATAFNVSEVRRITLPCTCHVLSCPPACSCAGGSSLSAWTS